MARRATPATASDDQVRALLNRYHCPVPFHAVRIGATAAIMIER